MLITNVKKIKAQEYALILESGATVLVNEETLLQFRLLQGRDLRATELVEIKRNNQLLSALNLAYHYLSYQLRSEQEVRDYLLQHQIASQFIPPIIEKLISLKLLDDQKYADSFVRTKVRLTDYGSLKIKQKLQQKGISEEIIDQSVVENFSDAQQITNAKKATQKLIKKYQRLSFLQQEQKIKINLHQKGFSKEIIRAVLDQLVDRPNPEEEWQKLCVEGEKILRKVKKNEKREENKGNKENFKQRQKIMQKLFQKGFSLQQINDFLRAKEL